MVKIKSQNLNAIIHSLEQRCLKKKNQTSKFPVPPANYEKESNCRP